MKVAWEKWITDNKQIVEEDYEDSFVYQEEEAENMKQGFLMTPIDMNQGHKPIYSEEDFNLWLGHSDFTITAPILFKISNFPGIETVDCISRYRFRVGIGRLFTPGSVLSELAKHLVETTDGSKS